MRRLAIGFVLLNLCRPSLAKDPGAWDWNDLGKQPTRTPPPVWNEKRGTSDKDGAKNSTRDFNFKSIDRSEETPKHGGSDASGGGGGGGIGVDSLGGGGGGGGDGDGGGGSGDGGGGGPDSKSIRTGGPEKPIKPAPPPDGIQKSDAPEDTEKKIRLSYDGQSRPKFRLYGHGGEELDDQVESMTVERNGKKYTYTSGSPEAADGARAIWRVKEETGGPPTSFTLNLRGKDPLVLNYNNAARGTGTSGDGSGPAGPPIL